ncbi:tripartite tricarboxylate transporter substrate binding protein [uncultured Tistrella sp.]|uniref:tripartite tricarboxylate transporter substrate binding protein n=1 Tax=Tistrella mobilis TaxID=171437 RepID=UPI000C091E54|nr:tripartite tricarboxylate transporter substrate binding protein [uncultured Tistrella sp.]MAM75333.1 C4-dicarboxylate ABC transporter [Tistrella sp.]
MKKFLATAVLGGVLALGLGGAAKAEFPEKNVRIIVPFSPGGAVDFTSRLIAEVGSDYLGGQKIIVENMPGGGAVVGQSYVARAKPDGYTVLAYTSSVINNPIVKKTPYTYKSFQTLAMYCLDPEVVIAPSDSAFANVADLVKASKSGAVSIATPGHSTSHHIAALVLAKEAGAQFNYIHNESAAMQFQQVMGGHVDAAFVSMGEALSNAKDGRIKILGVMTEERVPAMPDVPTLAEVGLPALDHMATFRGLAVPAETPREVVDKLAAALEKVVADPRFVEGMNKGGYPIAYRGPDAFSTYVDKVAVVMEEILPTLKKPE